MGGRMTSQSFFAVSLAVGCQKDRHLSPCHRIVGTEGTVFKSACDLIFLRLQHRVGILRSDGSFVPEGQTAGYCRRSGCAVEHQHHLCSCDRRVGIKLIG